MSDDDIIDAFAGVMSRIEDLEVKEKALQDWGKRARRAEFAAAALTGLLHTNEYGASCAHCGMVTR